MPTQTSLYFFPSAERLDCKSSGGNNSLYCDLPAETIGADHSHSLWTLSELFVLSGQLHPSNSIVVDNSPIIDETAREIDAWVDLLYI